MTYKVENVMFGKVVGYFIARDEGHLRDVVAVENLDHNSWRTVMDLFGSNDAAKLWDEMGLKATVV